MNTHNIGFYEDLTKIIFKLSSNTHLISSVDLCLLALRLNFVACFLCNIYFHYVIKT